MKAQENISETSLESIRERAKAIYLTMPIVRHLEVAQQCGVSIDLIKRWHIEDGWLELRAAFQAKKTGRLKDLLGDPVETAARYAALCKLMVEELDMQMRRKQRGYMGADSALKISKALSTAYELHDQIFRDTNVIKEKKTRKRRKQTRRSK